MIDLNSDWFDYTKWLQIMLKMFNLNHTTMKTECTKNRGLKALEIVIEYWKYFQWIICSGFHREIKSDLDKANTWERLSFYNP